MATELFDKWKELNQRKQNTLLGRRTAADRLKGANA